MRVRDWMGKGQIERNDRGRAMRLHVLKCSFVALAILAAGGKADSAGVRFLPAPFQSATGLVGHWPMDTIAAGATPAAVGPNPLTLTNGPVARAGVFNAGIL